MSQPLSSLLAEGLATPQPDRAHRLLVAQRLVEAVEAVHAAGGVIGNLDPDRVQVAPDGTVTLSDEVGVATDARTPAYTAPELQGSLPAHSQRGAQHDCFALAVLLFQLLMEGNHPYAGQWVGGGNLPDIPKAIQLGLYAYGSSAAMPPPGAPALSTLEPGLADLFKRSFAPTSAIFRNRPTGAEWGKALTAARQTGEPAASGLVQPSPMPPPARPISLPAQPALPPALPIPMPDGSTTPPADEPAPAPLVDRSWDQRISAPSLAIPTPAPSAPALPNPALPVQKDSHPEPATTQKEPQLVAAKRAPAPGRRRVSRRVLLGRLDPPPDSLNDLAAPVQANEQQGSVWSDVFRELLWLAAPHSTQPSSWGNFVSEVRWLVDSELQWLKDPEFWKRAGKWLPLGLLILALLWFGERGPNPANRGARPAVVQSTRVPATQTPRPQPTATRTAVVSNPAVASFENHFNVPAGRIPSSGERFSASLRDQALRMEAYGKGAHGRTMFHATPASGDFTFTVRVGSVTGSGEVLIFVHEPAAPRTWVLTVDPEAVTWGLSVELSPHDTLTPVIAQQSYRNAVAGHPFSTISVTRNDGEFSVLINGARVSGSVARNLPEISGPVTMGIGAMIPEDPADYTGQSFVVMVDYVTMIADKG